MNIRNCFSIIGRLTKDPAVFDNSDGSKKVRFTLAAQDNFASGEDKQVGTQFLPVRAYIPKDNAASKGLGVYGIMHKGDLVGVSGQIKNNDFTDRSGVQHHELALYIEDVQIIEFKAVRDDRNASRADGDIPA